MRLRSLLLVPVVLLFAARCEAGTKTKPATPAKGDQSSQPVAVDTPYCDAYVPYGFDGTARTIKPLFSGPFGGVSDDQISNFLIKKQSVSDTLAMNGSFNDPGYPIFGSPPNKLYSDGSDLTRLVTRLAGFDGPTGNLVTQSLCAPPPAAAVKAKSTDDFQYYLVHVVHWKRVAGAYQTDSSDWYIFNRSDKSAQHRELPFTFHPLVSGDKRIFGSSKVFFLAIHLAPSGDGEYDNFRSHLQISYTFKVTKVQPANIQDLQALINVVTGGATTAPAQPAAGTHGIVPPPSKELIAAYRAFLGLGVDGQYHLRTYDGVYGAARLTGLKSLPVQIASTMNAKLPTINTVPGTAEAHQESGEFWNYLVSSSLASPQAKPASGATASGCSTLGNAQTCPETLTVQNEGLYWWDVSIGIPFKTLNQLQVAYSTTGQVTPQKVSKASAYGFIVLAPWKEDIVSPPSLGIPHILIGVPITGKVLDSPFVGAGETFNLSKIPTIGPKIGKVLPIGIRFYAGLNEYKEFGPQPSKTTPPPYRWIGKLQYGIEFSVRDIASKLTSAAKGTAGATSSK